MSTANNCQQTPKLLEKLLSADAEQRLSMQDDPHLKQCAVCNKTFQAFVADFGTWQKTGIELPADLAEKIIGRQVEHHNGNKSNIVKGMAVAAAAVVAGLFISHTLPQRPEISEQAIAVDYALLFSADDTFPVEFFNE